ncbi:hypothetical protein [Janthinobacterium sp. GW458P]|uniref:hypothetical protein n=1 Tax=Janthinobacterium sp. GW458P TaxID=1981504 RepID=UPI001C0E10DB|nr:hypothetical protein [Janthinobacterium sp. GW458P]
MKFSKRLLGGVLISLGMSAPVVAFAGPQVLVTVKNLNATEQAVQWIATNNEISTQANASPTPAPKIPALEQNSFRVQSNLTPIVNYASLIYTMGRKQCQFHTAYTFATGSNGVQTPQWSKVATPSGGAVCTATITSTDMSTHAWAVTFTMK